MSGPHRRSDRHERVGEIVVTCGSDAPSARGIAISPSAVKIPTTSGMDPSRACHACSYIMTGLTIPAAFTNARKSRPAPAQSNPGALKAANGRAVWIGEYGLAGAIWMRRNIVMRAGFHAIKAERAVEVTRFFRLEQIGFAPALLAVSLNAVVRAAGVADGR